MTINIPANRTFSTFFGARLPGKGRGFYSSISMWWIQASSVTIWCRNFMIALKHHHILLWSCLTIGFLDHRACCLLRCLRSICCIFGQIWRGSSKIDLWLCWNSLETNFWLERKVTLNSIRMVLISLRDFSFKNENQISNRLYFF